MKIHPILLLIIAGIAGALWLLVLVFSVMRNDNGRYEPNWSVAITLALIAYAPFLLATGYALFHRQQPWLGVGLMAVTFIAGAGGLWVSGAFEELRLLRLGVTGEGISVSNGGQVYYRGRRVAGADPATAVMLEGRYWKDANAVYSAQTKIVGADPGTARVIPGYLSDGILVDRSAVYFSDKRLPLDPDSVEVVSTYFLKDRTSVWYYRFDATGTAMERLEGADAPSFRVLGLESRDLSWAGDPSWAVDVNHVYDYRTRAVLPGADAATFEPLNAWYAKDRAAVYGIAIAWEKNGTGMPTPAAVIAGADSASFRLLPSAGKDEPDAQDATGIYFDGRRLPK